MTVTVGVWELIVGFMLGILTNFIVWAVLSHYFVPKIRFSKRLSKVPIKKTKKDRSGYRYRFKIENSGRRDIIDVELTARLGVKGLRTKNMWNILYIPLNADGSISYRIPKLFPAKEGETGHRKIIFLHPNSAELLRHWTIFPEEIRCKTRQKTLLFEDLLRLGSQAKLEIHAFCYDRFSGSRKLYVSDPYARDDIVEENFDPMSLDVIPAARLQVISDAADVDEWHPMS